MTPPLASINEAATVRLVPTAHAKPPVLEALAPFPGDLDLIAQLEGLTSGRLTAEREGLPGLDPRELTYKIWGHTYINAAFTYTRPEGNRFSDATRGAWYCAFEDLTALDEVIYHRTRELTRINHFEDSADYQSLLASFVGTFHDVRAMSPIPDYLGPDPATAYPAGQTLARTLREDGANGIVYPSVRRVGGTCLVAFHPHLVQNVRFGGRWHLEWTGEPTPTISGA